MRDAFAAFSALHRPGAPLFLVNAWDVLSALALADAGHRAVGTTSLGLTAGAGQLDGTRAGSEHTRQLTAALQCRLGVPLSVDAEDGYWDDPAEVAAYVEELVRLGAVGVNLEDAGRPAPVHAEIVATVVARVSRVFVNARTDVFWSGSRDVDEALERCRAYRDAGAHCLFVPGLSDPGAVERLVRLGLPLNLLWGAVPDPGGLGVARVSTGSALYRIALAAAIAAAAGGVAAGGVTGSGVAAGGVTGSGVAAGGVAAGGVAAGGVTVGSTVAFGYAETQALLRDEPLPSRCRLAAPEGTGR